MARDPEACDPLQTYVFEVDKVGHSVEVANTISSDSNFVHKCSIPFNQQFEVCAGGWVLRLDAASLATTVGLLEVRGALGTIPAPLIIPGADE